MTIEAIRLECLRLASFGSELRKETPREILANAQMFAEFVLAAAKPRRARRSSRKR